MVFFVLDVNECKEDNGGCHQLCFNSEGSFTCGCQSGYTLADDKKTCKSKWNIDKKVFQIIVEDQLRKFVLQNIIHAVPKMEDATIPALL